MHELRRISKEVYTVVELLDDIYTLMKEMRESQKEIGEEIKLHLNGHPPETWLTPKEAAAILHIDIRTLHNWKASGKLVPKTVGGRKLYALSEITKPASTSD